MKKSLEHSISVCLLFKKKVPLNPILARWILKGHFNIPTSFLNFFRPDFCCICHVSYAYIAHTSLFDLVILTILSEDPDFTNFSSSCFVLYFIIPTVSGFILSLSRTAVFTAHVMNEYETLVDRCLTKKQSSRRETCSIATRSIRNLTWYLVLVLGLVPRMFLTTLLVMIN